MTDDELDLLASAYLDGEATSEEVDMVERDPELLARVEALRSISEQVAVPVTGPSAEVKEQHLATALAAFGLDAEADAESSVDGIPGVAPVIDLTERARRPSSFTRSNTSSSNGSSATASSGRTMPRWLAAAAALLLFGGAGAIIASQGIGGDDDATEAATTQAETDTADGNSAADFDESAGARAADGVMAEDAGEEAAMELAEEATDDAATEDEAMGDEAIEEESDDAASESAPVSEDSEGGFFPEDPVLFFDAVPDPDEVLRTTEPDLRVDVSQSQCGDFAAPLTDGSVLGYLPIEVAGEPAELFVLARENDTESAIILAIDGCRLFTR